MTCHIQLKDLALTYRWRDFKKEIFRDLDLCIPKGAFVTISGANGSGKSSLIKLILGLETPSKGDVLINDVPVLPGHPTAVRDHEIAYLSQQIEDMFFSETVDEELNYGADPHRDFEIENRLGISALLHRRVETLSGGEKQSLALVQFMLCDAPILLLDEPSSYLDDERSAILKNYLKDAHAKGKTIIHITQYAAEGKWGTHHIDLDAESIKMVVL